MIAWVVDFAGRMIERYPDSPDPLAEPAVVLVDEIDLHLHPKWQRELIGFLTERFPNTQFIVTAHSPLIVQAAAGANIALLKREGDHVVIENHPETHPRLANRSGPDQRPVRPGDRPAARCGEAPAATQGVADQAPLDQGRSGRSSRRSTIKLGPIPTGESFEQAKRRWT